MNIKKFAILASGDEIITGRLLDTNSVWIAKFIQDLGYGVSYMAAAGDNDEKLKHLIEFALQYSDGVIITGGLGPTEDDRTRHVMADLMQTKLLFNFVANAQMYEFFKNKGRKLSTVPTVNHIQCMLPIGAEYIPNLKGTACGIACLMKQKPIIAVPGVPHEMKNMLEWVSLFKPHLLPRIQMTYIVRLLTCVGISEALLGDRIQAFMKVQDPVVGVTAKTGYIIVSVMGFSEITVHETVMQLQTILEDCMISDNGETPIEVLFRLCKKNKWRVGCVESCTGGLIADAFVSLPGASEIFVIGAITYANEAKLSTAGVAENTLITRGAVSEETVKEMAENFAKKHNLDLCLSSSGVAGPDGGTDEKPVGFVWLGIYQAGIVKAYSSKFVGNRQEIRVQSTASVISACVSNLLFEKR